MRSESASLLFRPCPPAPLTTAKRVANRAGHLGSGFNCALARNSESDPPVTFLFPAEHNFIPFYYAGDFAWAEGAGVIARQLFARLFEDEGKLDWPLAPHILQAPRPGKIDRSRLSANRRQTEARRKYDEQKRCQQFVSHKFLLTNTLPLPWRQPRLLLPDG